jgi:hypothetical protein
VVGERAISQSIGAANGKLAALLRAREEDEQLLQIGRVTGLAVSTTNLRFLTVRNMPPA